MPDRDLATERALDRAIDRAVPALTEKLDELVPPGDHLAGRERRSALLVGHREAPIPTIILPRRSPSKRLFGPKSPFVSYRKH